MAISVIIPAFNEERYLPETLSRMAAARLKTPAPVETIVVDNDSTDDTRSVAEASGARVVPHAEHNISSVRNAGAARASGEVFVFIDADTHVPEDLLAAIADVMQDARCHGGAVAVEYEPSQRSWVRMYLRGWKFWGRVFDMKQGAAHLLRNEGAVDARTVAVQLIAAGAGRRIDAAQPAGCSVL